MNEEIVKLINFYINKDKSINKEFISEIINLVLTNDNLSEYIFDIEEEKGFGFFHRSTIAVYSPVSKLIRYNYKKLISEGIKKNKSVFSNVKLSNTYLYLYILQMILHEIEHARQFHKIDEMITLEDYILKQEMNFLDNTIKKLKNDIATDNQSIKLLAETLEYTQKRKVLYEFSPVERLADIYAKYQTCDIANYLDNPIYKDMMMYDYYQALLRGYHFNENKQEINVPTKYFFDKMSLGFVWDEIIERTSNLSDLEKIKLGLGVNQNFLKSVECKSNALILKLKK